MAISARLAGAMFAAMLLCGQAQAQAQAQAQPQAPASSGPQTHLALAKVQAIFADLKAKGVDVSGEQPWCYFFLSYDRAKLDEAAKALTAQGYAVVDLQSQPNALPDGPRVWQLQVRRVEHLTPEGVVARDDALYAFAQKSGAIYYDGLQLDPTKVSGGF